MNCARSSGRLQSRLHHEVSIASSQQARQAKTAEREDTKMRVTKENLQGRTMISSDAQVVGEVSGIFLDSKSWRVESLQVKLGKDMADALGADHSIFRAGTLEVPVRMIQSVGDTVVLSVKASALREVLPAPTESEADRASNQDK
jgi:sporulation protein YlmC with PRC-barrel domain